MDYFSTWTCIPLGAPQTHFFPNTIHTKYYSDTITPWRTPVKLLSIHTVPLCTMTLSFHLHMYTVNLQWIWEGTVLSRPWERYILLLSLYQYNTCNLWRIPGFQGMTSFLCVVTIKVIKSFLDNLSILQMVFIVILGSKLYTTILTKFLEFHLYVLVSRNFWIHEHNTSCICKWTLYNMNDIFRRKLKCYNMLHAECEVRRLITMNIIAECAHQAHQHRIIY